MKIVFSGLKKNGGQILSCNQTNELKYCIARLDPFIFSLRQYFPKSMEIIDVTKQQVFDAVHKLNSRPKKCLGFKTLYEVFEELTGIKQETLTGHALIT